jgi:hypothetical protein
MIGHSGPIVTHYDSKTCEYSATVRPKGAKDKINMVKLVYCRGKDLYRFEFYHFNARLPTIDLISTADDIFCEDMQSAFSEATGLATRLF